MKRTIRITENELHKLVTESIKKCLNEFSVPNQINHSGKMQMAVDNGVSNSWANDYLADKNTYYGNIAKLAKSNNTEYTTEISELQKKVSYYLSNGYFGENQEVVTTIQKFIELLAYMHGLYEAALSRVAKRMNEDSWAKRGLNYLTHKDTNSYGVKQHINDKSGNQYAVQQNNGQWMVDLQNQLKQFLQWNFLHGKKTVEATQLFIKFLDVEKRGLFAWGGKQKKQILNGMRNALIGVAALGGLLMAIGGDGNANNVANQQNMQPTGIAMMQQKQQTMDVSFNINKYNLSQSDIQKIQSLPAGTYKIVVHNTQNKSGKDASYENQLAQARANEIMKLMKGSKVTFERGENVMGNMAQADIIPM